MLSEVRDKFSWWLTIRRNLCSSLTNPSKGILAIASVVEGKILIPSDEIRCPKNTIDCFLIWHLVLFSLKPFSLISKKTFLRHSSCFCNVFPYTAKSFWELALPGMSEIIEVTSLQKTSLAEWIPYGKHLKWYLPEGVPKVSKFELCSSTLV